MLLRIFKKTKKIFLDLFFPLKCLSCGKVGQTFCRDCQNKIVALNFKQSPSGELNGLIIALDYNQAQVKTAIRFLKYQPFLKILAKDLAGFLIKFIERLTNEADYFTRNKFVLVPIPLSRKKLAERGFNQSELVARELSNHFNWPVDKNILKKIKNNISQTKLGQKQRKVNVKGVYRVISDVCPQSVILVDDIFTTGATLNEVAKTLRQAGTKEVWATVLAKD